MIDSSPWRLDDFTIIITNVFSISLPSADAFSDATTESSAADIIRVVTPMKTKYYDILYEDADDVEVAEDAVMPLTVFAGDVIGDAQTEEGVRSLEAKHQMTLQGMKELVLGSVSHNLFSWIWERGGGRWGGGEQWGPCSCFR